MATAARVAAHALGALATIALLTGFVLALRAGEATQNHKPKTAATTVRQETPGPVVRQLAGVARRDPPIIYVYGPPEVAAAMRMDLTAGMTAAWLDGDSPPFEVIIDGLQGGQRKMFFVDLR